MREILQGKNITAVEICVAMLPLMMEDKKAWKVTRGIPSDTKLILAEYNPYTAIVTLFLEHPTFSKWDNRKFLEPFIAEFKRIDIGESHDGKEQGSEKVSTEAG